MGFLQEVKYLWGVFAPHKMFPPKPAFATDQIPDLTGRVAIVTGEYAL